MGLWDNADERHRKASDGASGMTSAFVYVVDRRGFDLATHSAMSVSLSQPAPCDIHIFCHRFMPEQASGLRTAMAAVGAELTFHPIRDPALEQHKTPGQATTPTLLKLSAVQALSGRYDRLVYLDHDILVFKPLDIEGIDFGMTPLAAVLDMDLSRNGALRRSAWASGDKDLLTLGDYFNAGFMVFDSTNLRRQNFLGAYAAALHSHERHCSFKIDCKSADQCALNMTFKDNWSPLGPGFNMQAGAKFTKPWQTAPVRHFCGTRKFLPLAFFRNDSRDVRHLNRIRDKLNLPQARYPLVYELLFRLNVLRKYRTDRAMRR